MLKKCPAVPACCAAATLDLLTALQLANWAANESRAGCLERLGTAIFSGDGVCLLGSGDGSLWPQHLRRVPLSIPLCIQGDLHPVKLSS